MSPIKMKLHMDIMSSIAQQLTQTYGKVHQMPITGRPEEVSKQLPEIPFKVKDNNDITRKVYITPTDDGYNYISLFLDKDWIQGMSYDIITQVSLDEFVSSVELMMQRAKASIQQSPLRGKTVQNLLALFA